MLCRRADEPKALSAAEDVMEAGGQHMRQTLRRMTLSLIRPTAARHFTRPRAVLAAPWREVAFHPGSPAR